jgi:mercuric ion transport protein
MEWPGRNAAQDRPVSAVAGVARRLNRDVPVNPSERASSQLSGQDTRRTASSAILALAGVVSAFLATGCCVGPALLAILGLGGAGLIYRLEPYRPQLATASAVLIASAVVWAYRAPRDGASGGRGSRARPRRITVAVIWVGAALAVALLVAPYLADQLAVAGTR